MLLQSPPMQPDIRQLVQAIHDCPTRLVLVTAGAGTQALSDLLGVAGATRTLLEALVPYSEASFDDFLGQKPSQYVTSSTARLMAGRSLTRARWLETTGYPLIGLACTATIVTDRPKRGEHRAHIAVWKPSLLAGYRLGLTKGARDRAGEEDMVSRLMLNALARACGVNGQLHFPLLPTDDLQREEFNYTQLVTDLQHNKLRYFGVYDHGETTCDTAAPGGLLSGAFNPLHDGHLELRRVAEELLGYPVAFELSVTNADKPPLELEHALQRIAQFAGRYPIFASTAPTFVQKARLYPGTVFVVGYDTAVRVLQPRYYNESVAQMEDSLAEISALGCRFLVAGRLGDDGHFYNAADLDVPPFFQTLFAELPQSMFRNDISSTELRLSGRKGSR